MIPHRAQPPVALARPLASLALAWALAAGPRAQAPGPADTNPPTPPTASWPMFVDTAPGLGSPSTFADPGTGRGLALVDVVGPDPADPTNPDKVGPPDGLLDLVQTNSNSPALPYGSDASTWVVPPIGTSHADCRVWRNAGDGTWQEVAGAMSPLDPTGWNLRNPGASPWGVIAADVEGDGDVDLFYPCGGFNTVSKNALMLNQGDGTFVNVTDAAGFGPEQASFGACLLDKDLDGDLDLYVANGGKMFDIYWSGPAVANPVDRLYENDGGGGFTDVAPALEVNLASMSFSATSGDLDRDGLPDLAVSCFKQWNKVFYNTPSGVFSLMAPAANPAFDYKLSDLAPDPLYPGQDFPSVDASHLAVLPLLGEWSMPIELADFNADGWLDVATVCWSNQMADGDPTSSVGSFFQPYERAHLYLNRGDQDGDGLGEGEFREVGAEVGFDHVGGSMGMCVGDYNGDGLPDVVVGGGGPDFGQHFEEDFLYVNEPSAWPADWLADPDQPLTQAFYEVGALAGTYVNTEMSHGLAPLARSGRLDLVVGNGGPAAFDAGQVNRYLENRGNADGLAYGLVEVSLEATTSAPGAEGARVELIRDGLGGPGQLLVQERSGGGAFASHHRGPLAFGLGQRGLIFAQVRWPSGIGQGRLLWPFDSHPGELTFVEPSLSLALDARFPPGGGMVLDAELLETGPSAASGHLFFATFVPVAPGLYSLGALLPAALGVTLTPGQPLTLTAPVSSPTTAVYALAWVDGTTLAVNNAAAIWFEPALELPPAGPAPPPRLRRGHGGGPAPGRAGAHGPAPPPAAAGGLGGAGPGPRAPGLGDPGHARHRPSRTPRGRAPDLVPGPPPAVPRRLPGGHPAAGGREPDRDPGRSQRVLRDPAGPLAGQPAAPRGRGRAGARRTSPGRGRSAARALIRGSGVAGELGPRHEDRVAVLAGAHGLPGQDQATPQHRARFDARAGHDHRLLDVGPLGQDHVLGQVARVSRPSHGVQVEGQKVLGPGQVEVVLDHRGRHHAVAVVDEDLDRVGQLVLVPQGRARGAPHGVEQGGVEQVQAAALEVGARVAGLFDHAPHHAGVVQVDGEVAPDLVPVGLDLDRQHSVDPVPAVQAEHAAQVLGLEEDVAEEEQEGSLDVGLQLADGVGDAQHVLLLDVGQAHAQVASVPQGLHHVVAQVPDDDHDVLDAQLAHGDDLPHQEGPVEDRQQRLGHVVAEGLDALALARRQDDALELAARGLAPRFAHGVGTLNQGPGRRQRSRATGGVRAWGSPRWS